MNAFHIDFSLYLLCNWWWNLLVISQRLQEGGKTLDVSKLQTVVVSLGRLLQHLTLNWKNVLKKKRKCNGWDEALYSGLDWEHLCSKLAPGRKNIFKSMLETAGQHQQNRCSVKEYCSGCIKAGEQDKQYRIIRPVGEIAGNGFVSLPNR